MGKTKIKKVLIVLFVVLLMPTMLFAHSGRTDSSGGHHDYQNKSGLGSYHYHCGLDGGGYPPHLHTNGCPYANIHKCDIGRSENTSQSNSSSYLNNEVITYKEDFMWVRINNEPTLHNTINVNNTNLVELKSLCEDLGVTVNYDSSTKCIKCSKDGVSFTLQIGTKKIWKGSKVTPIEVAPIAYNGRTMVPVRLVAEAIGKMVTYDSITDEIVIW